MRRSLRRCAAQGVGHSLDPGPGGPGVPWSICPVTIGSAPVAPLQGAVGPGLLVDDRNQDEAEGPGDEAEQEHHARSRLQPASLMRELRSVESRSHSSS